MMRTIALALAFLALALPALAQDGTRSAARDAMTTPTPPPIFQVYVAVNGQQVGPLNEEDFKRHVGTPEAAAGTLVWMPGMANWAPASTVPSLQPIIASIGQTTGGDFAAPADPAAFMLGVWISEPFTWTIGETKFSSIVQMKLLPDGRFEGATLFRPLEKLDDPIRVSHEKGTWAVSDAGEGQFNFVRDISYTDVIGLKIIDQGRLEDSFVLKALGPNNVASPQNVDFVRLPDNG